MIVVSFLGFARIGVAGSLIGAKHVRGAELVRRSLFLHGRAKQSQPGEAVPAVPQSLHIGILLAASHAGAFGCAERCGN